MRSLLEITLVITRQEKVFQDGVEQVGLEKKRHFSKTGRVGEWKVEGTYGKYVESKFR